MRRSRYVARHCEIQTAFGGDLLGEEASQSIPLKGD